MFFLFHLLSHRRRSFALEYCRIGHVTVHHVSWPANVGVQHQVKIIDCISGKKDLAVEFFDSIRQTIPDSINELFRVLRVFSKKQAGAQQKGVATAPPLKIPKAKGPHQFPLFWTFSQSQFPNDLNWLDLDDNEALTTIN